jgi:hypothetical protein
MLIEKVGSRNYSDGGAKGDIGVCGEWEDLSRKDVVQVMDDAALPSSLTRSFEIILSMASCTIASDSASNADVASSSNKILGFLLSNLYCMNKFVIMYNSAICRNWSSCRARFVLHPAQSIFLYYVLLRQIDNVLGHSCWILAYV